MASRFRGVYKQSGVIPLFQEQVVLITARNSDRWIIPKGYIETGMSPADSAAKEALEEAGLLGKVGEHPIGKYRYNKSGRHFVVLVYPFFVETMLEVWDEVHERERRVVSPEVAATMVAHSDVGRLIRTYCSSTHKEETRAIELTPATT